MYYLILLFIFVLFCFFFLSVFFVERTSVILAKNTWKRKTVFCIMWSNEHFTNRQRHKKKNRIIINLHLGLNRKNTFNAVRNQRQTQLPWQRYKEGQFWKDSQFNAEYWGQFGFKDEIRKLFKRSMNNHRNVPIWIQADLLELRQNLLSKQ